LYRTAAVYAAGPRYRGEPGAAGPPDRQDRCAAAAGQNDAGHGRSPRAV